MSTFLTLDCNNFAHFRLLGFIITERRKRRKIVSDGCAWFNLLVVLRICTYMPSENDRDSGRSDAHPWFRDGSATAVHPIGINDLVSRQEKQIIKQFE